MVVNFLLGGCSCSVANLPANMSSQHRQNHRDCECVWQNEKKKLCVASAALYKSVCEWVNVACSVNHLSGQQDWKSAI